jgi:hypothetical protein
VPNYCARKFWKKLSISIVGVKNKLRRLSTVGKHWQRRRETEKQGMNERDLFLIGDISGFTPQISRLVSIMHYVRYTTLSSVEGLGVDELDYWYDPQSNSIGALLLHIAAAEVGYQAAA